MKQITPYLVVVFFTFFSTHLFSQAPVANFSSSNSCIGDSTVFTDNSTNTPTSWSWNFGDGSPIDSTQNPTHIYANGGTYAVELFVSNAFGSDSIIIPVEMHEVLSEITAMDVSCAGLCDGSITLTPSGGISPYTFNWNPGGMTTQNVYNLCPGTYSFSVTDTNGCMYTDNVTINQPTALNLFLTPTDATCYGAADGMINSTPIGGTPAYVYSWNDASNQVTQNASGLTAGTYTLTVTDDNGCMVMESATINEPQPDGVIAGVINFQGAPIDMGAITLVRKDGNTPADLSLAGFQPVFTGGTFEFQNVEAGNYILKARGDTTMYDCVPTYSDGTIQWDLAMEWDITSNCTNDSQYVEINLIEVSPLIGNGDLNGQLVEIGGGFGKAPGDPIPDIDITVEQSPGGSVMTATTTDTAGYFTIHNLPAGSYTLYADMHGYNMNISQTFDFDGSASTMDIILCSNDTNSLIHMCENLTTSISSNASIDNSIEIYPNPVKDALSIYNPSETAVSLTIMDVTGKVILTKNLTDSFTQIGVSGIETGIYFVRVFNDKINVSQKLIIE